MVDKPTIVRNIPDNCTLCGKSFINENGTRDCAFPYPPKHYLCKECFISTMNAGLSRLNKVLATGNLDLSVYDISDLIKPEEDNGELCNNNEGKIKEV